MTSASPSAAVGQYQLGSGGAPALEAVAPRRIPPSALAARLIDALPQAAEPVLFVAATERRADEVAHALAALADDREVLVLPPWDNLPYDRAPPSRESMGRRMAVLARLTDQTERAWILVTSPEALVQRTPAPHDAGIRREIARGDDLDRDALAAFFQQAGYIADDRVDEAGEVAILGAVIDIFPADAARPVRVSLDAEGRIDQIRRYDPVSQRTDDELERVVIFAAAEPLQIALAASNNMTEAEGPTDSPGVAALTDYLPSRLTVFAEPGAAGNIDVFRGQIADAFETRLQFTEGSRPWSEDRIYAPREQTADLLAKAIGLDLDDIAPAPRFAASKSPGQALKRFLAERREAGYRTVVTGLPHELKVVGRTLKRVGVHPVERLEAWANRDRLKADACALLVADIESGFVADADRLVMLTCADILGGRLAQRVDQVPDAFGETELRLGDVVIHEDHGLGVLTALERVQAGEAERDVLRLEYHGGASILAPIEDFGRIWRYGSEAAAVTLDRLNTPAWRMRRAEVSREIDAAAEALAALAEARARQTTDPVAPSSAVMARFAAGFAFPESADQAGAIAAVLSDLAAGRPMNRLVCGDVGFGKTEVALRAAAAVAATGRQVMVVAPTTILARQHFEGFRRRMAAIDVQVGHLSGATDAGEAARIRAGLADGSIRIVIGTQALASEEVVFSDLALVVIDEEHRFGARLKSDLASRAPHLLSLSATPIPRTLQGALVGLQDVSIIASPPARRRPVRTFITSFDPASVRLALMREHGRGGQSFFVAPRIEDLGPLTEQLAELVPELRLVVAHGKLKPSDLEEAMARFAGGDGDVLLATSLIENGLDIPRANTMLTWRPDRFGLAQLHQLRGRVGRGRRQGFAYLLSDPDAPLSGTTLARLQTLEALDRLGAGFALSARDLDLRGAGDLIGEEQAGHMRLIGAALYQDVMARALRAAKGERAPEAPRLSLGATGHIPSEFVPDPTVRINLYNRLARLTEAADVDALQDEIEDRFGPLPEAVVTLFDACRVSALAAAAGVTEVTTGPRATAFRFADDRRGALQAWVAGSAGMRWSTDRLIVDVANDRPHDPAFLEALLCELAAA